MPFTTKDVKTKKATTSALKRRWVTVANNWLDTCKERGGTDEGCAPAAIRVANGVIARAVKEDGGMAMADAGQVAVSAIEAARSIVEESGEIDKPVARALLDALEVDLAALDCAEELDEAAHIPDEADTLDEAGVSGDLRDQARQIEGAFHAQFDPRGMDAPAQFWTKSVFKEPHELGNLLVVEERNGGNLWGVGYTETDNGVTFQPRAEWRKASLTYTLEAPATEQEPEEVAEEMTALAESVADYDGDLAELDTPAGFKVGDGRRAPVIVEFQVIKPGPGNKRDNHYYPADMLKRDAHVFENSTIFVTDHKAEERGEKTKVGRVRECPVRFTAEGAPIARTVIYDPGQAEKARNRRDAGELHTLECSIFARGRARQQEVDGKKYKVVEALTEGRYLELVSKAGAGGHAVGLSECGGDDMTTENPAVETEPTPAEEVEEVNIEETNEEPGDPENQEVETQEQSLSESDVQAVLGKCRLPDGVKEKLAELQYKDEAELQEVIESMIGHVKAAMGSGMPGARGKSAVGSTATKTVREEAMSEANARFFGKPRGRSTDNA